MRFTSRYPFVPRGPKRVEIIRNVTWTEVIVRVDRVELGRMNARQLAEGVEFPLRDKGVLRVWVERGPRNVPFLHVTRNGRPLPGSEGDPAKIVRDTVIIMCVIALLQIAMAAVVIRWGRPDAVTDWTLGLGVILLLLAFLAAWRSLAAMVLGTALCFGEIGLVLATQAEWNIGSVWPLTFALGITAWLLWRGVVAVRTLNENRLPIRRPPEMYEEG